MSLRVQVNLGDEMLRQVDCYAEKMGVSRSALCSVLIGEGILDFNSKQTHEIPENIPSLAEPHLFAIEKRLHQLFAGWVAQFENMPDYQPNITVQDGKVYVDEQYLCEVEEDIAGGSVESEGVYIYLDKENKDVKMLLYMEWENDKPPFLKEICEVED